MMNRWTVIVIAAVLIGLSQGVIAADAGWEKMFNGKDLTGWEGKPGGWTVEDGAITGRSTKEKPCLKHHYLMWRGGQPGTYTSTGMIWSTPFTTE